MDFGPSSLHDPRSGPTWQVSDGVSGMHMTMCNCMIQVSDTSNELVLCLGWNVRLIA